ncbi:hypothetical protein JN535_13360 [Cellulosimicrobium cellulans]|uniref:hypothetical protein n=1 Tax=Cellulosimicrobium cellulans TaxID=1710 RepID=UPI001964FAC8|nr:hypothetical protein [Cellulosimicrobium cellulans]MBN0041151.1 hypothetical protein [Cellulosimicrobium cellulans]
MTARPARSTPRRPIARAVVPVLVAAACVVALGACSTATEPGPTTSAGAPSPSPTEDATDVTVEPSEDPTDEAADPLADRPSEPPAQAVDAGTVAAGAPAAASGTGSAAVSFVRDGDFAVVVHLDCGECAGTRAFLAPTDVTPYPGTLGEATGSYLMDVFEDSAPQQSIWLETEGDWSVRFESWNDLPPVTGAQSGTGSTVLRLDGTASSAEVSWAPAGPEDSFQGRYFGVTREASRMFGDTEAFTETFDLVLPGVLAVKTAGTWSVTPQG